MATKRITISVPVEVAERMQLAAGSEHSVSEWVTSAITRTLDEEDVRRRFIEWCEKASASPEEERQAMRSLERIRKGAKPARSRTQTSGRKRAA